MLKLSSTTATSSPGFSIDTPDSSDVVALIALVNVLATEPNFLFINKIDPESGIALVRDHLKAIAINANEAVFVAREGRDLIGLICGIRGTHPARRGVIDIGIGVLSQHRGRGIGYALMLALERWALDAGCHRLQLRVTTDNPAAVALYRKCGFVVEGFLHAAALVGDRYYDDLKMAKLLGAASRLGPRSHEGVGDLK